MKMKKKYESEREKNCSKGRKEKTKNGQKKFSAKNNYLKF